MNLRNYLSSKMAKNKTEKKEIKETEKVKEESVEELKKQNEELICSLQRLQADFENYKKRIEKQNEGFCKVAHYDLIKKMLPMLDSFELALKNKKSHEEFIKGIELIYAELFSLLNAEGLRQIKADGKFDPNIHEVLLTEKANDEDIILEELQKGYMLNNILLRTSKVKVSKK